nr:ComF family protein [Maliibacterium massiliense]
MAWLERVGGRVLDFLAPPDASCVLCGGQADISRSTGLCGDCARTLSFCGPIAGGVPAPLAGAAAALWHTEAGEALVHRFKFQAQLSCGHALALLMLQTRDVLPKQSDLLIPVPLHPLRRMRRGFNQAAYLCRLLARATGLDVARRALRRTRNTPHQVGMTRQQRRENIHGAFALCRGADVAGRHVVLVDDVFTTGATLAECARVLRAGGAASVFAWCATAAPLREK